MKVQNTWFRHRSFITGRGFSLPVWVQLSKSLSSAIETKTIFIIPWATVYNQSQVQPSQIEQYIFVLSSVTKFWMLEYLEIINPVRVWQTIPLKLLVYLDSWIRFVTADPEHVLPPKHAQEIMLFMQWMLNYPTDSALLALNNCGLDDLFLTLKQHL